MSTGHDALYENKSAPTARKEPGLLDGSTQTANTHPDFNTLIYFPKCKAVVIKS